MSPSVWGAWIEIINMYYKVAMSPFARRVWVKSQASKLYGEACEMTGTVHSLYGWRGMLAGRYLPIRERSSVPYGNYVV